MNQESTKSGDKGQKKQNKMKHVFEGITVLIKKPRTVEPKHEKEGKPNSLHFALTRMFV